MTWQSSARPKLTKTEEFNVNSFTVYWSVSDRKRKWNVYGIMYHYFQLATFGTERTERRQWKFCTFIRSSIEWERKWEIQMKRKIR